MSTPPQRIHTTSSGSGIGCLGLAFFISLVLCILKVAGVLELSWFLALAPLLIVLGLGAVALLILLLIVVTGTLFVAATNKRGRR